MKISIQLLLVLFVFSSQSLVAGGSVEAGKSKATPCAACHGADGNSTNPAWPKLAGQGAPYIAEQLKLFKEGTRSNPLMSAQATGLSEQDMLDLAEFYASQTMTAGAAEEELVELGEAIYRGGIISKDVTACAACHGPSGAGIFLRVWRWRTPIRSRCRVGICHNRVTCLFLAVTNGA